MLELQLELDPELGDCSTDMLVASSSSPIISTLGPKKLYFLCIIKSKMIHCFHSGLPAVRS